MGSSSVSQREITRRQLLAGGAGAVGGLIIGGIAGSALAPKGSTGSGGGSRGSVKVVGIFPTGGAIASDGKEMANGTKMAVDEINGRGGLIGYHLDYVQIDDKDSSTDQITTAFNRAVSVEKADVIFSGYHLASGPEFDIVANAGALYYNVNTQVAWVQRYKGNPGKYWGIFQCDPTEAWYGQGFAFWVDGALFSVGDAHAAQGDGEVCVTAVEMMGRVTLRFGLAKGRELKEPQFRTRGPFLAAADRGPCFVTTAAGPDLFAGAQQAIRYMIEHLATERGLSREEAYILCSVAVDLKISEIVDAPNWIVSAFLPESIFA